MRLGITLRNFSVWFAKSDETKADSVQDEIGQDGTAIHIARDKEGKIVHIEFTEYRK